ncbi:MAG: hypothetical protein KGH57_03300 [Candidatus Micrarchaeota archaeon]|nr:hypothetical protein [Candidatus Micrarchaeota archaeon]
MVEMGIDVVDVVSKSFRTLFGNQTVLIYAAIGGIISALLSAVFLSQFSALSLTTGGITAAMIQSVLSLIGAALVALILVILIDVFIRGSVISAANLGKAADMGKAAGQAMNRYLPFLFTLIVVAIAVGIGYVLLIIPGIYLTVKLSLAPVEAVVGRKGVVDSLSASWHATDGNFWSIFLAILLMLVVVLVISGILGIALRIVGLAPAANFVSTFVGYAFTVMIVLIYQQIGVPAKKMGRRAK